MPRYRKSDVQTRWEHGRELPCVNVKVRGSITRKVLAEVERYTFAGFADWAEGLLDRDKWPDWTFGAACESGWESIEGNAAECFPGYRVKVYGAGRSGGWCIVEGLPPVESWDAVMLGRWARFEKWARAEADNVPRAMADLLAFNRWEDVRELVQWRDGLALKLADACEEGGNDWIARKSLPHYLRALAKSCPESCRDAFTRAAAHCDLGMHHAAASVLRGEE